MYIFLIILYIFVEQRHTVHVYSTTAIVLLLLLLCIKTKVKRFTKLLRGTVIGS